MRSRLGRLRVALRPLWVRLRQDWVRLALPRADVALAVGLAVLAIIWATRSHDQDWAKLRVFRPDPFKVLVPEAPRPPIVTPDPYSFVLRTENHVNAAYAVNLIAALPLAFRRRWPYAAFIVSVGGVLALHDGLLWPGFIAIMIAAYSVVAYGRYLRGSLVALAVAAALAAHGFSSAIPPMPGWLSPFAVLAPVGLAAASIRNTRARADASARRAVALEHEQEAVARAAIAEERARIARELHDVVSHHVSVMVIQAGAAGKVIDTRPDLATAALAAIESSGREAMGELRHLLGLVAPLDDRLHPQPGLGDLDALIDSVRAAGQPVTLRHEAGDVPRGLDLTAYRMIQEGLTNALRYAPGAATTVEVRRSDEDLIVEVRNEAPSADASTAPIGTGSGLVGLAERVRLHDGTLEHGPRAGGGFRVRARMPMPAPVSVA